ncbi:carboxypeptidase-like regulatory domain-containing protein [Gaetbulibacter aestuarii]|uniref:Carboxypeptidase-like regulatory domain-containing protein n=1 Tax=Gaetbulibacter aestuarii TaxID=1502358 RepID=A0ABW7N345_9FLAO
MKKALLLLFLFTTTITFCQSKTYSGIVKDKNSKTPIPGVVVKVKGTEIGTQTDFEGNFKISVPDSLNILEFLFVGYRTFEYKLGSKKSIEIFLKEDCNKDFFDAYEISLLANSGLFHNPIGTQLEITSPYTRIGVIKGSYSYQTNRDTNTFQFGELELRHPISNCDFDMDFRWNYKDISFERNFFSRSYAIESQLNLHNINLIAGYSHMNLNKIPENKIKSSSGILMGLEKELFLGPFYGTLSSKVAMFNGATEFQSELQSSYKWFTFFLRYYSLDRFNELSLGVGVTLNYYKWIKSG